MKFKGLREEVRMEENMKQPQQKSGGHWKDLKTLSPYLGKVDKGLGKILASLRNISVALVMVSDGYRPHSNDGIPDTNLQLQFDEPTILLATHCRTMQ